MYFVHPRPSASPPTLILIDTHRFSGIGTRFAYAYLYAPHLDDNTPDREWLTPPLILSNPSHPSTSAPVLPLPANQGPTGPPTSRLTPAIHAPHTFHTPRHNDAGAGPPPGATPRRPPATPGRPRPTPTTPHSRSPTTTRPHHHAIRPPHTFQSPQPIATRPPANHAQTTGPPTETPHYPLNHHQRTTPSNRGAD